MNNTNTIQPTKPENKNIYKSKNKNSYNDENTHTNNINTNYNNNYVTSNIHRNLNTLSPLNNDSPAGIIYSPNCENFQKRKNA